MGRPVFEITSDVIKKAESLAATGLTLEQVAHCLGIHYDTLNEKRKISTEFSDAIKRGKDKGIGTISNALFESARKGNVSAQIFYLKSQAKWYDVPSILTIKKGEDIGEKAREQLNKYVKKKK